MGIALTDPEKGLEEAVLATVAWFDVFGYPLTLLEVARHLPVAGFRGTASLSDIATALASPLFTCVDGHYSLTDGDGDIALRRQRFRLAKRKLVRARRAARLFGLLPSVRLVAACNNLAVANAEERSDIDLFIVCRAGTLWSTRLLLAGLLKTLNLRPTPEDQRDKLCLSFWVSESGMDLSRLALEDGDPYMDYWIATLLPLYDAGGVYAGFRDANSKEGSNTEQYTVRRGKAAPSCPSGVRSSRIERLAKRIQMRKFPGRIRAMANLDSRVVVSDDTLKFHVNDRREAYRSRFLDRIASLGPNL